MRDITIKDIARRAGVSISTVSRVINDNYPVRQEVREKVEQVMRESEYRPNAVARSLRINKTNLIALVIADLSNHFFMEIAKGLEMEIAKMGCQLVIASSGGDVKRERELISALMDRRIDAMVLASSDTSGEMVDRCLKQGLPVVLVDRSIQGVNTHQILWNDFDLSYRLTRHLIDNGHRKIAMVNVTLANPNGCNRLDGYRQALRDAGIPISDAYISPSNFRKEDACRFVTRLMGRENPPTAVFCANNIMLEGTLAAFRALGLRVYDDVSVAAIGSLLCNEYITPQITSAEQDSFSMGRQAGEILSGIFSGATTARAQIVLESRIVERGSVKRLE